MKTPIQQIIEQIGAYRSGSFQNEWRENVRVRERWQIQPNGTIICVRWGVTLPKIV